MYEVSDLVNEWPASDVGGVPVKPSYRRDPLAVLVRLSWADGRALWVPGHANRWNRSHVLVTVTPDETDRRTETMLWVHRTDVTRALPAEPSTSTAARLARAAPPARRPRPVPARQQG